MEPKEPILFAVKHKDERVISDSRSGGVFTALSDIVLSENGVVYGCVLTDEMSVVHVRAETEDERNRMRGSKYVQSKLGDTFVNVKKDLEIGRKVLFSGTSCQVAGLRRYLRKEYSNLICIDIVCHGVPSSKVWKTYLEWQEKRAKSKISKFEFRNKKDFGWREHIETIYFENGEKISSKIFTTLFYSHTILRPSCYECPYKTISHPGDISIADYWGIEKAAPEFDDNKGVSLLFINNDVGEQLFENIKEIVLWRKTRLEDSMQPPLIAPFPKPSNREQFWDDFRRKPFEYIAKKYAEFGTVYKVKRIMHRVKRKILTLLN